MNSKIEKASKNFDSISLSGSYKGKFLPDWLHKKSIILTRECKNHSRRFYNSYKNGTIVMINFGVNIGNELCNNHFAIVLNKKDNKSSSTLTVIPISSKENKYYHKLNDEVFRLIMSRLVSETDQLFSSAKRISEEGKKLEKILESKELQSVSPELQELVDSNKQNISKIKNEIELFFDVKAKYKELAKESFACISSVQTISKERIRKINQKDPSGNIRLSKKTMDNLDKEFIKYFTNLKV